MNRTDRLVYRVAKLEQVLGSLAEIAERVAKSATGGQEEQVLKQWLGKEAASARRELESGKEQP